MRPTFALFCNPESRRVEGFSGATGKWFRQWPILISWLEILESRPWHEKLRGAPRFLRLESPGRNWQVEKLLLSKGAEVEDEEADRGWRRLSRQQVDHLQNDPGVITPMRQWFLGWRSALKELGTWARQEGFEWLCQPMDVVCMFDKAATQGLLEKEGFPVPPSLGLPRNFDELWETMRSSGHRRVFLKPCHGSSASGVVALESSGTELQAFSTAQFLTGVDEIRLYNWRRIRTWRGSAEIRRLVDAVCRERCIAQAWVPKAGLQGKPFDLRVVVVGGRARQVMVRLGRGPITNSQLLGGKGEVTGLRKRMGEESWHRMLALCERAMATCFPGSLYAGFDVLIEPDFRTSHIAEVNAFGDLLPHSLHEGRTTYESEVEAVAERLKLERPGQVIRN